MCIKKALLGALLVTVSAFSNPYPDHWWEPLSKEELSQKPSWEITPDMAKREKNEVILSKRNELGKLLSNFGSTPFVFEGFKYPGIEGFWQMMKYPDPLLEEDPRKKLKFDLSRAQVSKLVGFDAKKAGSVGSAHMKTLEINWVSYRGKKMTYRTLKKSKHFKLIQRAMYAKVLQNKNVKQVLLKTKGLTLLPDHKQKEPTPPAWKYHQILMDIREALLTGNTPHGVGAAQ